MHTTLTRAAKVVEYFNKSHLDLEKLDEKLLTVIIGLTKTQVDSRGSISMEFG